MTPRVLLTGGSGQLGWELRRCLCGFTQVFAPTRAELDLASADSIRSAVHGFRPDLVINPAAYTAVDQAESEPDVADAINATAVGHLGVAAREVGAAVVQYSTDYVFPGTGQSPWRPDDVPAPLSAYGRSKLEGERALVDSGAAYWIIRTSWLYGAHGKNFVLTMLRLLHERQEVRVVDDQIGAPTWVRSLAQATVAALMPVLLARTAAQSRVEATLGVYHVACRGETSWHGLTTRLRDRISAHNERAPLAGVLPVPSEAYAAAAVRPKNSRLDCTAFERTFGVSMPRWDEALDLCLADIVERRSLGATS